LKRLTGSEAMRGDVQAGLDPCAEMRYVLDMTRPYDNLLMTQSADGSMERYSWGNELLGAAGEESYFYLQDHLHSPIRLVDGAGVRDDEIYAYDEFGVQKVQADLKRNPFGFTGYQPDAVSGLHYAQARYYDPANARMIAEDPIRSGLNWYGYCGGNPVNYVDPTGLVCEGETGSDFPNIGIVVVSYETWKTSQGVFAREFPSRDSKDLLQIPPGYFVYYGAVAYDRRETNEKLRYWVNTPDGWMNARHIVNPDECIACGTPYPSQGLNIVRVRTPPLVQVEHVHEGVLVTEQAEKASAWQKLVCPKDDTHPKFHVQYPIALPQCDPKHAFVYIGEPNFFVD